VKPHKRQAQATIRAQMLADAEDIIDTEAHTAPMGVWSRSDSEAVYREVGFTVREAKRLAYGSPAHFGGRPIQLTAPDKPTLPEMRYRTIDNMHYQSINRPVSRDAADALAATTRRKFGVNARVIESKDGWSVFVARSFNRRYNATVSRATLPQRLGSYWFPRATARRRKKSQRRAARREAEQRDTEFTALTAHYGGGPDGAAKAAREQKEAREQAERTRRLQAAEKTATVKARESAWTTDQHRWEHEWEVYRRGVPFKTAIRYNAMELTGATTGLAAGIGLIALAGASIVALPLAVAGGILTAKAIRRQPTTRNWLNASLDKLESGSSKTVNAFRTSKDKGRNAPGSFKILKGGGLPLWRTPKPPKPGEDPVKARKRLRKKEKKAAKRRRRRGGG
jgi:hypothetical protein